MKNFLISLLILAGQSLYAQDSDSSYFEYSSEAVPEHVLVNPTTLSDQRGYDAQPVDVQRFDRERWKEVVGDEDFEEVKEKKKPEEEEKEAGEKGKDRFQKSDRDPESSGPIGGLLGTILTIFVYAAAIGIIGYILYLILQNVSFKTTRKVAAATTVIDVASSIEEIQELEIDRHLREALAAGNYKLAIRICFLGLLKKLDEDGMIKWKKDKTNREYLSELYSKARHYDEIRKLTGIYELVWYGDHELERKSYEEIITAFKTMHQNLNKPKTQ